MLRLAAAGGNDSTPSGSASAGEAKERQYALSTIARLSADSLRGASTSPVSDAAVTSAPRKGHVYNSGPTFLGDFGERHTQSGWPIPISPKKVGSDAYT